MGPTAGGRLEPVITSLFEVVCNKKKKNQEKERKPNHLKFLGQHPLPIFFFLRKNQPEASEAKRKAVSGLPLRAEAAS